MTEQPELLAKLQEANEKLAEIKDFESLKPYEKMEKLWHKANRTLTVLTALEMEPRITQDELRQLVTEEISENEAVFLGAIVHTMQEMNQTVTKVENAFRDPEASYLGLAQEICGQIHTAKLEDQLGVKIDKHDLYEFEKPPKVTVGDYAVYIEIDSADYVQIRSEATSGMFNANVSLAIPGQKKEISLPVIMIRRDETHRNPNTKLHEEGHLFNAVISRAHATLPRVEYPELIGEIGQAFNSIQSEVKKLSAIELDADAVATKFEELQKDPSYEILMGVLLSHASDEITADMYTGSERHKIARVKNKYNIVAQDLEIKPDAPIAKLIKADLDTRIDETSKSINSCYLQYLEYMPQRAALMPILLQDIPMSKWRETLEESEFFKEYSLIEKATQRLYNMESDCEDFHPEKLAEVKQLKETLVNLLHQNQLSNHVVEIRAFEKNLQKIQGQMS